MDGTDAVETRGRRARGARGRDGGGIFRRGEAFLHGRHKAIALAVQRADEVRGPSPFPQRLPQGLHTGFERLVPHKLLRPQVLEQFLGGHDALAMPQEIRQHLEGLAPELDRRPCAREFQALGIKDKVTKAVAHRPPLVPVWSPCRTMPAPKGTLPAESRSLAPVTLLRPILAHQCPEDAPKMPRRCHVVLPGKTYPYRACPLHNDAGRASQRADGARDPHDREGGEEAP